MSKHLYQNQSGIAHMLLIVVIVAAVGLASLAGYGLYRHNTNSGASLQEAGNITDCNGEEPLPDRCVDSDSSAEPQVIDNQDDGPADEL